MKTKPSKQMQDLARNIRTVRESRGETHEEFAAFCHLPVEEIRNLEDADALGFCGVDSVIQVALWNSIIISKIFLPPEEFDCYYKNQKKK